MERNELILIGPIGAGKSTLGALIAKRTGLRQYAMDEYRWQYYDEIGYDAKHVKDIEKQHGFRAVYSYWKPFEAHAVQRMLVEQSDCVIDFGAGHSVFEDAQLFERVREALSPFRNVVLILPSADEDESIEVLANRIQSASQDVHELNAHFVRHHSNRILAKYVIYTNGKTPEETAEEVIQLTGLVPSSKPPCGA